ncbi:MAG: DUF4349 domain-containing protein [Phycisphaerae bacterium]
MLLRPQVVRSLALILILLIAIFAFSGCAMTEMRAATVDRPQPSMSASHAPPPDTTTEKPSAGLAAEQGTDLAVPISQRMLIYTGQVSMAVADIEASLQATQRLADEVGGYMLTMRANTISIRVPAKQFFPVLERLRALGQTLSKNITAQDVTDEYTDLQLRLKNVEALRDRLMAILEKAGNLKDTLEVERELNRVREEIERIKGQIAQMDKLNAFSTIEVSFTHAQDRPVEIRRPETPFPWLDYLGVETVLGIRG